MDGQLTAHPCQWFTDLSYTWEYLFKPDAFQELLDINLEDGILRDLAPWEVNIAIAAVVEAIDGHQRKLYTGDQADQGQPFPGGLSVASTENLQWALMNAENPLHPGAAASRPRRCWLIPLVVSGELLEVTNAWRAQQNKKYKAPEYTRQGHTILVVIQEEPVDASSEQTQYVQYFVDSRPHVLGNAYPFLAGCVQSAAARLLWSSHRNDDTHDEFATGLPRTIPVPEQAQGWACGHHTIINA
ncbi:hypothetical protein CC86DRAFT_454086 [Ophiobolus disseminans]|uniref:Uncharacterized protein n=1 Tax=Ophiobolus disseminans TaxID=1469910 RepID=A0A6A7A8K4_9PLEO|nr:hypothetical protein CC86DRAFT_454086 [Ophiobolus disseminans]